MAFLLVVSLLASLLMAAPPLGAEVRYADRVRETVLENGLKVLLLEERKAPVATVQVWYRVGSRDEQLGRTGLAHLLEHLMFKGTEKLGPEDYSRIIQRNGGNENAFTSSDNTTYFATLASDRISVALELEADRMVNLRFDDKEFHPELQVVMEERRLRTDDKPIGALFEALQATAFQSHPYGWPIIGWMNDLQRATREDALAFYRQHYVPNHAFLVIAGDFDADALLTDIRRTFGAVPAGPLPDGVRAREPRQQGERRTTLRRPAEMPFVAIGYRAPNLHGRDAAALEVLAALLGNGKSSRLHARLVYEARTATSAGASYDLTSADPSLFTIYAQAMPGQTAAVLERQLLAEVARLQKEPVSAAELAKIRNSLEAQFVLAQDSLFYQSLLLGQYEIAGDWRRLDDYLPAIRQVTPADVQMAAQIYLTEDQRTVATLDPIPPEPDAARPAAASRHGGRH